MRDRLEAWILLFIFVVLPVLQWVGRKIFALIQSARAARLEREMETRRASTSPRSGLATCLVMRTSFQYRPIEGPQPYRYARPVRRSPCLREAGALAPRSLGAAGSLRRRQVGEGGRLRDRLPLAH